MVGACDARADNLEDAQKLLSAGQHAQALAAVNKALAAKPRDAQARFLKGVILTEQGNSKEAIELFSKLTQDYPQLPEPYNNLAVIYAGQGQYEKARQALEQSIRTHPSYATAYENLGDVYAKLASQAYAKALQLDKSNTGAQNKLSLVREISGGTTAAAAPAPRKEAPKEPVVVAQKEHKPAAAPAPAASKPAGEVNPAPAEKPAPAADPSADVLTVVNAWAQAWSKKDVEAYLSHYAKDFKTPQGEPRADWEKVRRARISAPKTISVDIANPKVTLNGDREATVTFRQSYRSDTFKATGQKTLVLVRGADGRWLIQQEKAG